MSKQEVGIVKYNAGNIFSVVNALERLHIKYVLTDDPKILNTVDKVIFPGVGEASSAMTYLKERGLNVVIQSLRQPVLGICLGMQILCQQSEENDTACLNVFNVRIKRFKNKESAKYKIPHVGWNTVFDLKTPLFNNIPMNSHLYFVHSFYAEANEYSIATCNYIENFSVAVQKDNFYGVQFHPEKSGAVGENILRNFLAL